MRVSAPRPLTAATREASIVAFVVVAFGTLLFLSLYKGGEAAVFVMLPLIAVGCAVCGLVLLFACAGSAPAVIAYLAVLVFVNDAYFRTREPGDLGLDWQNGIKFALWAGAGTIGAVHLGHTWRLLLRPPVVLGIVYIAIALTSSLYSAAPSYSFSTAFGVLAMLLFAGALITTVTEKQILLGAVLSLWVFVLAGWVIYFEVPSLGRSPFITVDGSLIERICGIAGQANALGGETAVSLALLFLLWHRGHCGLFVVLPIGATSLFTLLATDSRTALLSVLFGVAAVIARRSLWTWGSSLLGVTLGVVLLAGVPLRYALSLTHGLSRSGDDPSEFLTLTGRTKIWEFAWDKIVLSPWVGYGYNSSKFILPQFLGLVGIQVDEAHNMWLQNLLGLGVLGTLPLAILVIYLLVEYVRAPDAFRDLFFFIMLVWGITVAGALGSTPTVMTLVSLVGLLSAARGPAAGGRGSRQLRPNSLPRDGIARPR